jgi:hypothetical protein
MPALKEAATSPGTAPSIDDLACLVFLVEFLSSGEVTASGFLLPMVAIGCGLVVDVLVYRVQNEGL